MGWLAKSLNLNRMRVSDMTAQEADVIISGFSEALRKQCEQDQLAAMQAVVDKCLQLGFAIDQPKSKNKPLDITIAAIDLLVSVTKWQRRWL